MYSFDKNTFKHGLYNFKTVDFDIIKSINFDAEIPIINKKCPPITQKLCTFNFLNSHLVKYILQEKCDSLYIPLKKRRLLDTSDPRIRYF